MNRLMPRVQARCHGQVVRGGRLSGPGSRNAKPPRVVVRRVAVRFLARAEARSSVGPRDRAWSRRVKRLMLLGAVCSAVLATQVMADRGSAGSRPKPGIGKSARQKVQKSSGRGPGCGSQSGGCGSGCGAKSKGESCSSGGRAAAKAVSANDGRTPRWVCPATTITLDPVWPGQPATCVFRVSNEGKGILSAREKRG